MKLTKKIILKKDGEVKAIIETNGKVIGDDSTKKLVEEIMQKDLIGQESTKEGISSTLIPVTTEKQLIALLFDNLYTIGYEIE